MSADNVSGEVSLDVPNVAVRSRPNARAIRARIGAGGEPIATEGVSKDVRLSPQGGKAGDAWQRS